MRNTLILAITTLFLLAWFPSFGPGDIIAFFIISKLGFQMYALWSVIIVIIAYNLIEGKGISGKLKTIHKEIKQVI